MTAYEDLTAKEQELVDVARSNPDNIITFTEAGKVYSRKQRADAFERLVEKGWAESTGFGAIRVTGPPPEDRQTFLGENYQQEAEP